MTSSSLPLLLPNPGVLLPPCENCYYVAVMSVDGKFVAVRGGRTTGQWSEREAFICGDRLAAEISGQFVIVLLSGLWARYANPEAALVRDAVTVREYIILTVPDPDHTLRQYKADPLVSGTKKEVK